MRTKVENSDQKRVNKLYNESFKKKIVQQIEAKTLTLKEVYRKMNKNLHFLRMLK